MVRSAPMLWEIWIKQREVIKFYSFRDKIGSDKCKELCVDPYVKLYF